MLSLGHAAYYAVAAYTSGLLIVQAGLPMVPSMLAGPLVAVLFALVFGIFIVKPSHLEHAYFLMLTLAFSQLVYATIYKWYSLTHGDDGISGILPTGIIGSPRNYGLFTLVVVATCTAILQMIVRSPFGLTLQAIRDNPRRAEFIGLSVRGSGCTVIARSICGRWPGRLHAFFSGTISPQIADWSASARPFLANTIGGIQSFWGPLAGVVILEVIDSQVGRLTEHSLLAVGALAILVGVFFPQGVIGLLNGRLGAHLFWSFARSKPKASD